MEICLVSGLVKSRNPSPTPTRIFNTTPPAKSPNQGDDWGTIQRKQQGQHLKKRYEILKNAFPKLIYFIVTQSNGSKTRINDKSNPLNNCPKRSKEKTEKECKANRSYKSSESMYILIIERDDISA